MVRSVLLRVGFVSIAAGFLLKTASANSGAALMDALVAEDAEEPSCGEAVGLTQLRAKRLQAQPREHAYTMPATQLAAQPAAQFTAQPAVRFATQPLLATGAASQPGPLGFVEVRPQTDVVAQIPAEAAIQTASRDLEAQLEPAAGFIEMPSQAENNYDHPECIHSCRMILLDVGSGVGVNVRKLFEPGKYKESQLLPVLDKALGSKGWRRASAEKTGLCALGLEPNPVHQAHLRRLQKAYASQGWNVHFYPFAAWNSEGFMPLNATGKRNPGPEDSTMEGAHLSMAALPEQEEHEGEVQTVDLAAFIKSLPAGSVKVMTMDVEGAEYETLAQLMQEQVMCQQFVGQALVQAHEWGSVEHWGNGKSFAEGVHPRSFEAIQQRMGQLSDLGWCTPGKATNVSKLEDKAYSHDVKDWLSRGEHQKV